MLANDQAVKWAKANVVSALTPFFVLVGWKTVQEPQKEDGKAKLKILRMYSSHQDAVGIHGEVIEFEWTFFPGFSTLSSFQEIQKDLAEKNIEPENFQDRIIFMSMFNDILWKTGDEKCILNAEKVKNYAKKNLPGHGTFLGPGSEEMVRRFSRSKRTVGSHSRQNGTGIQGMLSSCVQKYRCFESWDLEHKKGRNIFHFNGDPVNTELLFQTVSFGESAQCLCSCNGLVLSIRFDK